MEERGGLEGMSKNTGVEAREAGFLTVMYQVKSVVDRKGCETPKGKTTSGWVSDVRCQLKSTVDWKRCQKTPM